MTPNETNLRAAVQHLRTFPFPQGIEDGPVSDLHAELAEFDGYINGLLQQLLRGESPSHLLERDSELRAKLEHARDFESDQARYEAKKLLAYLDVLERAIDAANQIHR